MKACIVFAAAIASAVYAAAVPATAQVGAAPAMLFRRAVTTDGTCGGSKKFSCGTEGGKCCSTFGFCGDSDEHCGNGCQDSFGICGSGSPTNPTPTTSSAPTPPDVTIPRTKPGGVSYGAFIRSCNRPGFVALTFDDGPDVYTPRLLDLLSDNGVVATFFVNGKNWGAEITTPTKAALLQRMLSEGHQIGSHTWDHKDLSTLGEADIITEMARLESALLTTIGKFPTYMRPPFFSCDAQCLQTMDNLGYHVIHSNLDTEDWRNASPELISNSKGIFRAAIDASDPATDSFIPLAHDVHETTVTELVQDMINAFKAKGFKSTTVGSCLDDNQENWYRTEQ